MIFTKIAIAFSLAGLVVAAMGIYDTWRNRKRYAAREQRRKAKGGLE